jgi:hypothetical protein
VLQQIVINTSDEVTGKDKRMISNELFDKECIEAIKNKE